LVDKCQLHLQEDGSSRFLSNIGTYIHNYVASHPMKLLVLIATVMKTVNLAHIDDVWEQVTERNVWN
jgi:hypothetical protein